MRVERRELPLLESRGFAFGCFSSVLVSGPGLNSTLKDQILSHPALHDALTDPKNGDSATKHLKQQVCVGHGNCSKWPFVRLSKANILFFLNRVINEISFRFSFGVQNLSISKNMYKHILKNWGTDMVLSTVSEILKSRGKL